MDASLLKHAHVMLSRLQNSTVTIPEGGKAINDVKLKSEVQGLFNKLGYYYIFVRKFK